MARPKIRGGFKMRNVGRVFFTTLAGLTLVVAVWAFSPPTTHDTALLSLSNSQAAAPEQSVSGKIASVEKNSFTLTVGQSQTSTAGQNVLQDSASPKTMVFQLDKNTASEGWPFTTLPGHRSQSRSWAHSRRLPRTCYFSFMSERLYSKSCPECGGVCPLQARACRYCNCSFPGGWTFSLN